MQIFHDLSQINIPLKIETMTIGIFDGVHKGHTALLNIVKEQGKQNASLVFSFSNHPKSFFDTNRKNFLILTLAHRALLIKNLGIDYLFLVPFNEHFSQQSPLDFLKIIKNKFNPSKIILGHDAVIGRNREGTKEVLSFLGAKLGIQIEYLTPIFNDGSIVSSSKIRNFISSGAIENASEMLGRPYSIYNKVERGESKGRKLGFPTANLSLNHLILPPLGVYKVLINYKNKQLKGIANLGYAPTVNKAISNPLLEVHIFNFDDNLYGEYIEVVLQRFIRPEKRFQSIDELIEQIKDDIKTCQ